MRLTPVANLMFISLLSMQSPHAMGQETAKAPQSTFQNLTLEKLFHPKEKVEFASTPPRLEWLDAHTLLEIDKGRITRIDARTLERNNLLEPKFLEQKLVSLGFPEKEAAAASLKNPIQWSSSKDLCLLEVKSDFVLLTLSDLSFKRLTQDGQKREAPLFSPDEKRIAYLKGNDLYMMDLKGQEQALTQGGSDTRLNGRLDWVYDEELYGRGSKRAFWWAPDSLSLAYLSFDQSKVKIHMLLDDRADQKQTTVRYSKAGEPMAHVSLGRVNLKGETQWMEDPFPAEERLIVQVGFDPSGHILAAFQNRIQTWLELRRFASNGKSELLVKETSSAWQDRLILPHFLKDGSFLWLSDRSGYRHIYRYDAKGRFLGPITQGSWDIRKLHGVDETKGLVYFSATEKSPFELHIYQASLTQKREQNPNLNLQRLSSQQLGLQENGTHIATFNKDASAFISHWMSAQKPGQIHLVNLKQGKGQLLTDLATPDFIKYSWGRVQFETLQNRHGKTMNSLRVLPPDFDPQKRYPIFQEIYGGPQSPLARDARLNPWHHYLAKQGYVVWVLDNVSATNQGPASAHGVYRNLGEQELQDQLDGIEWLKKQSWADTSRMFLDGWSYGGFMSAYAMSHSPQTWKAAVVGAPVTDFSLYDSIYTERYMGLPKDNQTGYKATRIMNHIKDIQGPLLIFHGTLDDNVHPQNSIQLIDALQKEGKAHELVIFPGAGHGPNKGEQTYFRYAKTWEWIQRINGKPDKQ